MILLPNFLAKEFRYFHATNEYFIRVFILQWYEYDTSPFFGERLPRKKIDFIWFSFLTSLALIEVYVLAIATSVICLCRIDLQCMRHEKHFVSVKSTTWMEPGQLKQIYILLALM